MKRLFLLAVFALVVFPGAFSQNLYPKTDGKGRWGYCDEKGKWIINPSLKFEKVAAFSEGFAQVRIGKKWGYYDTEGECVIPCRYEGNGPFKEGRAYVFDGRRYGYIDTLGRNVVPFIYVRAKSFSDGRAVVATHDMDKRPIYGYIDRGGKVAIPCQYDRAYDFADGIAFVFEGGNGYAVDTSGKIWFGPFNEDPYSTKIFFEKSMSASLDLGKTTPDQEKSGNIYLPESQFRALVLDRKQKEESKTKQSMEQEHFLNQPFPDYAKEYVETKMNAWQKKGEFEKMEDYRERVTEDSRNRKIKEYTQEAKERYIAERSSYPLSFSLSEYDSENEVFLVKEKEYGNLLVPVPIAEAQSFKKNWNDMHITPSFQIAENRLSLASVSFSSPDGHTYRYDNDAEVAYVMTDISYHFDPVQIDTSAFFTPEKNRQTVRHARISLGKSDVDVNIPQTMRHDSLAFAVIIANENYSRLSHVPYALNDGTAFSHYCRQTLGIPEEHIRFYADATYGTMLMAVKDIQEIADVYRGNIEVVFYYAGHGAPQGSRQEAYLLPVDSYGVDNDANYPLSRLYRELGELPARSVTVFLDACFSGATREGDMLASARSVSIKPQINAPSGNTVVFCAASGDETALPFTEKKHGLFTYYLLKKLQETEGNVSYEELGNYILEQVKKRSVVLNRKSQSPNMTASPSMPSGWEKWKL